MTDPTPKKAPSFKAPSSAGREVSLDDYRGKYLVLYFYPKSFTAGCTIETAAFRDASDEIRALGGEVVGVSTDSVPTQCRFAAAQRTDFPILADSDAGISRAYGVLYPIIERAKRITFVIDPEGYIVARFRHELLFKKHIADAIAFLKARA